MIYLWRCWSRLRQQWAGSFSSKGATRRRSSGWGFLGPPGASTHPFYKFCLPKLARKHRFLAQFCEAGLPERNTTRVCPDASGWPSLRSFRQKMVVAEKRHCTAVVHPTPSINTGGACADVPPYYQLHQDLACHELACCELIELVEWWI